MAAFVASLVALVPPHATASNMGFTQRLSLPPAPGGVVHWISLPYRFAPADVGTPGVVDAEDLCGELGPTIAAILRWDEAGSVFVEHPCGGPTPFPLAVGTGYGIRSRDDHHATLYWTGSHDEGFVYSLPPTAGGQLHWLSVPPHLRVAGDFVVDAEDLCRQIGAGEAFAIVRWDRETEAYRAYGCGSELAAPFDLVRGEAYGVVNAPGQTIDWQPEHF